MEIDQSISVRNTGLLDRIVLYSATLLFALTVILATTQVFVRLVGFIPGDLFYWTVPLARLIFIVMTYVGAAVAIRNQEHISIDMLLDRLEKRNPLLRTVLDAFVGVAVIVFLAIALYGLYLSTVSNWTSPIGGLAGVNSGYVYLGMGTGVLLMLIYSLDDFRRKLIALLSAAKDTQSTLDETEVN